MTKYYLIATHNQKTFDFCMGSHLSVLSFIDKYVDTCDIDVWNEENEIILTLQRQDTQSIFKAMLLSKICPPFLGEGA